jgi:microcystin-dependent protein
MEAYIGQIIGVGFKFEPVSWMVCDGRLLDLQQYFPLFTMIGTTYGGNGRTNFAIPDLRGRVAVHQGQGGGLSNYDLGQAGGEEYHTLSLTRLPSHSHPLMAVTPPSPGTKTPTRTSDPGPTVGLTTNTNTKINMYGEGPFKVLFDMGAMWYGGQGLPHENRQPLQVINYLICYEGISPTQG